MVTATLSAVAPSVTETETGLANGPSGGAGGGGPAERVMVSVWPETCALTAELPAVAEYDPEPPTTATEPEVPHVSVIAFGATLTAVATGAAGPALAVTVTVTRLPRESVTMIGAAVGHDWPLPTDTVKRPGCVLEVAGVTWTPGLLLTAV
jgi:hypothetical protein